MDITPRRQRRTRANRSHTPFSMDGVSRRPAPRSAAANTVAPVPQPAATPPRRKTPPISPEPERPGLGQRLQTPAFIVGGIMAGFGMQSLPIGLGILALYAIIAWLTRVYSHTSFALALAALIAVPIVIIFRHNTDVAGNFATYTFVLIVIGTVSLIRENPGTGRRYINPRRRS